MKAIITALALLVSTSAFAWEQTRMNTVIDETNYLVNDNCSGTLVTPTKILTAAHCVESQYKIVEKEVVAEDGEVKKKKVRVAVPGTVSQFQFDGANRAAASTAKFKLVATDTNLDLAIIEVKRAPGSHYLPATVGCGGVARGDTVYAVGNPLGALYSSLSRGMVASTKRTYADLGIETSAADSGEHPLVQHTASIAPVSSGGALYNDKGELIGVNVRGARGYNIYFSVSPQDVRAFLNKNGVKVC